MKVEMKEFDFGGLKVRFWYEGRWLFCKVFDGGQDIYCCGVQTLPETEKEAIECISTAWIW